MKAVTRIASQKELRSISGNISHFVAIPIYKLLNSYVYCGSHCH